MRNNLRYLLLLAVLSLPATLVAQNSGVISGVVTDPSQAVVPNAAVKIVNADTGVVAWHGITNESGVYRAPELRAGRYNVSVEMQGFKQAAVNGVNLAVDQRASIDVILQTGGTTESVTVVGTTDGQPATETASLGSVINPSQVESLPMPSRNILNLLSMTAGVSSGGDSTGINDSQLSFNGSRTVNSEFMVEGASVDTGTT